MTKQTKAPDAMVLLPCPFCGSPPEAEQTITEAVIRCANLHGHCSARQSAPNVAWAADKWNHRITLEASQRMREALGDCELCAKPLMLGQFVNQYDDIDTAHANCERPFAKPSEPTPAPGDDGSTMPTYVLLGEPALLEEVRAALEDSGHD